MSFRSNSIVASAQNSRAVLLIFWLGGLSELSENPLVEIPAVLSSSVDAGTNRA
jgi:hypothetical protein